MLSTSTHLDTRQGHVATSRLQQSVRLLQMSAQEFAAEMANLAASNPFLELPEDPGSAEEASLAETPEGWPQAMGADRAAAKGRNDDLGALDYVAAREGLQATLTAQVHLKRLSPRERHLACAVIESLDEDGYLRTPLPEVAMLTSLDPRPSADEMDAALSRVQELEPTGIGARDLAECLQLQLRENATAEDAECWLALDIVRHHMASLAGRDIPGIARRLHRKPDEVAAAVRRIQRLDPRPGWRHSLPDTQYVRPDVVVRKVGGAWRVRLNPEAAPRLRVNALYAELFERHRDAHHGALASQLKDARWTVRNIAQRLDTICAVAEAILARQQGFLEFGALAMRPLGLQEIADAVGVHESTVCRVTNNKFMATPLGVFELKYFFSRAMATDSGADCSAIAIRGVISQLIADESAARPLSDAAITRLLNRQGLPVARRTVTKYRQGMKLPIAGSRRRELRP